MKNSLKPLFAILGLLVAAYSQAEEPRPSARLGRIQSGALELPAPCSSVSPVSLAQTATQCDGTASQACTTCSVAQPACFECGGCPYPAGRVWGYAEYLYWWTQGSSLPPLATGSPTGTPFADAGVLGRPGTVVLFGNERVDGDGRSGGRFTLGAWLNAEHTFGLEGSFFFLEDQSTHFTLSSDGNPIIARPFFDVLSGTSSSVKTSFPNVVRGTQDFSTSSSLLGAEIYARHNLRCCDCSRLDLIAGYRYLQLDDDLLMHDIEISTDRTNPLFGLPIDIKDAFHTDNDFHGGLIGLIGERQFGCWYVRGVAKVALGCTHRRVTINGTTQVNGAAPELGGLLALPSNIGTHESNEFSVVPEVGVFLGYNITDRVRVFGGYSFLYWCNVARPGDQVDLRVNTSQGPLGNGLVGPAFPVFEFRNTDYWAQGLSIGLEIRY